MIKPRSAIARIGVGLVIAAGLSLGVPAASFAQEEFDTSQVSSITQNADTGITTCTNNADKAFSFQCAGTSATGYRQKDDSSSLYLDIQGHTGKLAYGAPTASGISTSFPHSCLKWLPSGFLGRKGEEDV